MLGGKKLKISVHEGVKDFVSALCRGLSDSGFHAAVLLANIFLKTEICEVSSVCLNFPRKVQLEGINVKYGTMVVVLKFDCE